MKKLFIKESYDSEGQYEYIKSKDVNDYDGWRTEYTMYYDLINDRYVFVFGDSDLYDPNDGYEEFDWECDSEAEANEWFDNYSGYDDLDESMSYNDKEYPKIQKGMYWAQDEFNYTVVDVSGDKAVMREEWIAFDTGEELKKDYECVIHKGDTGEYLEYVDYPGVYFYANSAFNVDKFYPDLYKFESLSESRSPQWLYKQPTSYGAVKNLVKKFFQGNAKSYKSGDWKIGAGGYDLVAELYYNNVTACRIYDNGGSYEIEMPGEYSEITDYLSSAYVKGLKQAVTDAIKSVYPDMVVESKSINESIYTDNGFKNRADYLQSLADDFGIDINTVKDLASVLGAEEDFDALVTELEDMADDYTGEEKYSASEFQKDLEYALHHYNYVVYEDTDSYEDGWIAHFDDYETAADDVVYDICNYKLNIILCDTRKHLRTFYDASKLDLDKLSIGEKGKLYADMRYFKNDPVHYLDPSVVGEDVAVENTRNILDMCEVRTEKY